MPSRIIKNEDGIIVKIQEIITTISEEEINENIRVYKEQCSLLETQIKEQQILLEEIKKLSSEDKKEVQELKIQKK